MSCTPTWDGTQPAQGKFCLTSFFSYVWKKLEVRIVNWIFMYTYNAIGVSCTSRGPEYFRAGCIPIRTRSASRSRRTSSFGYTSANLPVLSLWLPSNAVKLLNLFLSHSWAEPCFDKFQAAEKYLCPAAPVHSPVCMHMQNSKIEDRKSWSSEVPVTPSFCPVCYRNMYHNHWSKLSISSWS